MRKQVIKLTESDLHRIIKESVKRILKEIDGEKWDEDEDPSDDWEFWEYHMQRSPEIAKKKFGY